MAWLIAVLAAVVPTIIYVWILWWFDRYEKEPRSLLLVAFLWGAVPAAILSIIAERWLGMPLSAFSETAANLISSSLGAPVIEEVTKGLAVLLLFIIFHREFDDVLDGIIYGATIGFGFAMTENALYFFGSLGSSIVIILRAFVFGLNHALFTAVFGASLGYVQGLKKGARRWFIPLLGLLGAIALHSVHNLFVALSGQMCFTLLVSLLSDWGGALVILVVMILAGQKEKRWIATHLQAEVASGLITQEEYDMIGSYRKRLSAQWRARRQRGRAEAKRLRNLAQLATELAFKLEQGDQRTAQKLRARVAALSSAPKVAAVEQKPGI